jgi:hypothetical protein
MGHRIRIKRSEDMSPFYSNISINESQAKPPPPNRHSGGCWGGGMPDFWGEGGGRATLAARPPHLTPGEHLHASRSSETTAPCPFASAALFHFRPVSLDE